MTNVTVAMVIVTVVMVTVPVASLLSWLLRYQFYCCHSYCYHGYCTCGEGLCGGDVRIVTVSSLVPDVHSELVSCERSQVVYV